MRIQIALDGREPPTGWAGGDGLSIPFQGWLGLLRALDQLVKQGCIDPRRAVDQVQATGDETSDGDPRQP